MMNQFSLEGKVALVTGAAYGIGLAIAEAFAKAGAKIVFNCSRQETVDRIGNMFPEKWSWYSFWEICAFLSVALAFMNVLPIPALDGGHAMFLLWEIITRRKPSECPIHRPSLHGETPALSPGSE